MLACSHAILLIIHQQAFPGTHTRTHTHTPTHAHTHYPPLPSRDQPFLLLFSVFAFCVLRFARQCSPKEAIGRNQFERGSYNSKGGGREKGFAWESQWWDVRSVGVPSRRAVVYYRRPPPPPPEVPPLSHSPHPPNYTLLYVPVCRSLSLCVCGVSCPRY